jgi:4-amino-4-deoxy-L-arabinose transferase-like glycosyltransferase
MLFVAFTYAQISRRTELCLLLILLLGGAFARFYALGSLPAGLNQDEASMGYDAYALFHHGVDRNGSHNPVHMIAWGSGQNALQAYVTIPFIALFDLSVFSIRLVPALFGVFCLGLFYWVGRQIAGQRLALLALFLLVISPWHLVLSRWALESNFLPGVILIAVTLLLYAQQHRKQLYLATIFFALSLYAYSTAYAFVPLFLGCYAIFALWYRIYSFRQWLVAGIAFIVVTFPIALFVLVNLFKWSSLDLGVFSVPRMPGEARYTHMTSFFSNEFWMELWKNFHRVIDILFVEFNDRETQSSVKDIGVIYAFSLPFFVLGLILFIRDWWKEQGPSLRLPILLWLFCAFLVAILTWPAVHRMNLFFFPMILVTAYALYFIWHKSSVVLSVILIIYLSLFVRFEKIYFTEYAQEVGAFFFESYTDAVNFAYQKAAPNHKIYLSDNLNQPYIHVLFITRYDVRDYIATVDIPNPAAAFQIVKSFGPFVFGVQVPEAIKAPVVVAKNDELWRFPEHNFISVPFKNYTALFNRNFYGYSDQGELVAQRNRFALDNQHYHIVSGESVKIALPETDFKIISATLTDFYAVDTTRELPLSVHDNYLIVDSRYLFGGANRLDIQGEGVSNSRKATADFVFFYQDDKHVLLDVNHMAGYQSFGALERDRAYDGSPLVAGTLTMPWGFGTHTDSSHSYHLDGNYSALYLTLGISQFSGNCGDGVVYEVYGDDQLLFSKSLLPMEVVSISVPLKGVRALKFNSLMKESPHCDHTNWMLPMLQR